jgi:D-alanyl-D-alanine carboxypeptidase
MDGRDPRCAPGGWDRVGAFLLVGAMAASSFAVAACGSEGAPAVDPMDEAPPEREPGPQPAPAPDPEPEPEPPPCDAAQTAAIQAAFADEAIPATVGAVAVVKDPACGSRYFTRGASTDVPETALHLIGSSTKTYIASLVLLLVEEGKVALTDPVAKWIPDVPGGDAVEVGHLLNHTSGIYNYTSDTFFLLAAALQQKYEPRDLLDIAFGKPPSFAPGAPGKWEYSNTNYVILGMIIEAVTGAEVAEVLRERILTPIGAEATFFNGSEPLEGEIAYGQSFLGTNGATFLDPSATWCAGNIVATLGDLVDWAERRGSGSFHSPAMQAEMMTGAPTGLDFSYGSALVMVEPASAALNGNGPAFGHGGDTPGYHSMALYFPEKKATIAVVVHSDAAPTSTSSSGGTYLGALYLTVVNPYFGTLSP